MPVACASRSPASPYSVPSQKASAALLFASAAGKHITGQILAVDGGISAVHCGG